MLMDNKQNYLPVRREQYDLANLARGSN
jgi:hypothetical protein